MKEEEVRQRVILEYLAGDVSLRTLAARYKYDHNLLYRWIMAHHKLKKEGKLLNQARVIPTLPIEAPMSTDVDWLQEELRIARIKILLLEATIDISDEQFGTDMRKKVGARQS
jgi:transposase-like protein